MEFSNSTTIKNQTIKNNSIINKIFDNDYLASLKYVYDIIIRRNDVEKARGLLAVLEEAIAARRGELEANQEIHDFYKKIIIGLKFIALPLLDDQEVIDLLANHFTRQFDLPDYDIGEKLSGKLLNILILEDRDKFKAGLKAALLGDNEKITGRAEIKTVADWLKDYNAKLGIGVVDNLKRAEYMVSLTKMKGLDERYPDRLKTLFNFYEAIKLSSLTPAGFDEEPPVVVDNKLYIFRHGVLEPVGKVTIKSKVIETGEINKIGDIVKPAAEKKFEKIIPPTPFIKEEPLKGENNAPTMPVKSQAENDLAELRELAAKYPAGSLERKTVEEEIERVKHE